MARQWLTLADGALEQAGERPLHPPGIGAGEVDRRDQRLGLLCQPLVTRQRLRPPFADLARIVLDPGARHPHRLGAEGPGELSFPVPVAIALRRAIPTMVAERPRKLSSSSSNTASMVARTLARSRSSIGSNAASPASSAKLAVSVIWFMA